MARPGWADLQPSPIRAALLVQTVIAPVCGPDGAVEKYISFGYDITESRTIQDDMAASAERYNLAIDGGNDGLWTG